jgi:hypothetical protein
MSNHARSGRVKFELPLEECPQDVEVQNVHLVGDSNE